METDRPTTTATPTSASFLANTNGEPASPTTIQLLHQLLDEIYQQSDDDDNEATFTPTAPKAQPGHSSSSSSSSSSATASSSSSATATTSSNSAEEDSEDSSNTWTSSSCRGEDSSTGTRVHVSPCGYTRDILMRKGILELRLIVSSLTQSLVHLNHQLIEQLQERDELRRQCSQQVDLLTAHLKVTCTQKGLDTTLLFSVPTMSNHAQMAELTDPLRLAVWSAKEHEDYRKWLNGMKIMGRIENGIPAGFRRRMWLILANRAIQQRKLDWPTVAKGCFSSAALEDGEMEAQIVKDLSRTGCRLFSEGETANQAKLKQVLVAYARFNKAVGYCQGFNMLAALILEVMDCQVEDSLKVMIYLIDEVLPESYYANNLRGLSVDMAVFRDLMRLKLGDLARHLERLQSESWDDQLNANYEPPLVNVFTMQWFLTIFSNTLPKDSVLRIWDLIFLEGNEVILRTALTIWDCLADRTMAVDTADEFYSIMAVLTREMMEFGIADTSELVAIICNMEPFPFPNLESLRENYIYNIRPLSSSINQLKKGVVKVLNTGMNIIDEENNLWRFGIKENWIEDQFAVATFTVNSANGSGSRSNRPSPNRASAPPSPSNGASNLLETIIRQFQMATSPSKLCKSNELKVSDALARANAGSPVGGSSSAGAGSSASSAKPTTTTSLAVDVKNKLKEEVDELKKQYIKLKQRQIQAELILEGKNPNEVEETIIIEGVKITLKTNTGPPKRKPLMATLLNGKTALVSSARQHRAPKRDSIINQALPRAFLSQFSGNPDTSAASGSGIQHPKYARSNTITSMVSSALGVGAAATTNNANVKPRASSDGSVAVNVGASCSGVKINVNGAQVIQTAPGPSTAPMMGTCSVLMVQPPRRDGTTPIIPRGPPPPPMISPRDLNREAFRRHTKSSSSSTSTELCDEILGMTNDSLEEEEFDLDASDLEETDVPLARRLAQTYDSTFHSSSYEADEESEALDSEKLALTGEEGGGGGNNDDTIATATNSLKPAKAASSSLEPKQNSEDCSSSADDVFHRGSFSSAASSTITTGSSSGSAEKSVEETNRAAASGGHVGQGQGQETDNDDDEEGDEDEDGKDLDECIRKFQHQIMRIKMEQSIN